MEHLMIIAIDGLDGVGKTTLISKLIETLRGRGDKVAASYAPMRTSSLARSLRNVTLGVDNDLTDTQRFLLSLSLIIETYKYIISEHKKHDYIFLDRFLVSHLFYNALENGVRTHRSQQLMSFVDSILNQFTNDVQITGLILAADEEVIKERLEKKMDKNWLDLNHAKSLSIEEKQTTMIDLQRNLVIKGYYAEGVVLNTSMSEVEIISYLDKLKEEGIAM